MNGDKKLYLYSGLAVAGAIIAYVIITQNKSNSGTSSEGTGIPDPETTVGTTTTGEIVDVEQINIPKTLTPILNKTSAEATVALINKPKESLLGNQPFFMKEMMSLVVESYNESSIHSSQ